VAVPAVDTVTVATCDVAPEPWLRALDGTIATVLDFDRSRLIR
jgi:hypothetical protein